MFGDVKCLTQTLRTHAERIGRVFQDIAINQKPDDVIVVGFGCIYSGVGFYAKRVGVILDFFQLCCIKASSIDNDGMHFKSSVFGEVFYTK